MNQELTTAVETIKTAILQSQYQAAKETTRVQLILYYGIGPLCQYSCRLVRWQNEISNKF